MPHISITAEPIGKIFGLTITNSILTTWVVMLLLIILGVLVSTSFKTIPGNFQSVGELVITGLHNLFKSIIGEDKINKFFPLLATFFLFIIAANWIGLLPGVGTIGVKEEEKLIPLFRGPTADLNTTLALALIAVFVVQYYGIKSVGSKIYLSKFLNFKNPILFFVGILEFISEVARILSFAFRLFGNIFAGEVLLAVIAFLIPLIVPLPFLGLEVFVGFIQALVFAMLTAVFLAVATSEHAEH
ncbi:F0F1 ATP synthase subunit A [Candidatus Gottesmanbacteria bacterium]|nr:F0F1 ATP synthase subunit A [Candidatus Gottesmanbacteria bacterium]